MPQFLGPVRLALRDVRRLQAQGVVLVVGDVFLVDGRFMSGLGRGRENGEIGCEAFDDELVDLIFCCFDDCYRPVVGAFLAGRDPVARSFNGDEVVVAGE
jgi:hypothetical protein